MSDETPGAPTGGVEPAGAAGRAGPAGSRRRGAARLDRHSLGLQVGVVLAVALVVLIAVGAALGYGAARTAEYDEAESTVRAAAVLLAGDERLRAGVESDDPVAVLGPRAREARLAAGLDYVVVMTLDGIRWTHPDPDMIGERYLGTIDAAREGEIVVEEWEGTLGPSVRAVAPILDENGEPEALVAAGVTIDVIESNVTPRLVLLVVVSAAVLVFGAAAAWAIHRRVDREAHGLGARDIARTLAQHEMLLRSVRAGYLLIGPDRTVELCNDEARRLLGLGEDVVGSHIAGLGLEPGLAELVASGRASDGEIHVSDSRTVVVTQVPVRSEEGLRGWVTTVADHTTMVRLTGVVATQQTLIDALRARAHEADNRLHTVVVLAELGEYERAAEFATGTVANSRELADRLGGMIGEPTLVALLLGKTDQARERGVELRIGDGFAIPATSLPAEDLLVVLGNLVDNAIDAAADGGEPRWVELRGRVRDTPDGAVAQLVLEVADSGPGLDDTLVPQAFTRGWSTKQPRPGATEQRGLGLSLVRSAVGRLNGRIEVRREQGAVFVVEFPVPAAGAERVPVGGEPDRMPGADRAPGADRMPGEKAAG